MTVSAAASGGYRANAASGIDRTIRLSTAAAVLAVAGIAAYVSYWHAYAVVRAHGENGITARLEPTTIDGLVYASSMVILYAARHRVPVPPLARWLLGLGIAATLTANMAQGWSHGPVGAVARPGQRPASSARMNSWSGPSAPARRWNPSHRQGTAAGIRRAALRRDLPRPRPLAAGSTAGATATCPLPGGRRISLPGSRPPPPPGTIVTGFPEPVPIMTKRRPRTGSARKPAIRCPNVSSPRCSAAPRAAGHAPGSPKHGNHRKDPTQFLISEQPRGSWQLRGHRSHFSSLSWAVRCAAACRRPRPGGVPLLSNAGSGSHPHPPGGTGARPARRVARPGRRRMRLRRSRRPRRADRPARPRARGARSPRRPARPGLAGAIGRGAARSR